MTAADLAANEVLLELLPSGNEGWLSEETADSPERLQYRRVWVVDPLDGTREFVDGIPEWCISIGLVEDGIPVAGGILSPATDQLVLGSVETGVTLNGERILPTARKSLDGAVILASRSEWKRGEWDRYRGRPVLGKTVWFGSLQAGPGGGGAGRRHLDPRPQARMGRGWRRGPDAGGRGNSSARRRDASPVQPA